jgi:hypothetical protein
MPGEKEKGIRTDRNGVGETAPTGINHLLVIAIDEYERCPALNNCVKDAKDFAQLLWERYQFEECFTTFLFNKDATRSNILEKLAEMEEKVQGQDSLLIYYSGHGETKDYAGYWIPVSGRSEHRFRHEWVSTDELIRHLDAIDSFHTVIIADACFSGSLFAPLQRSGSLGNEQLKSRLGLAASHSRGKALDGTPGENSPFAERLLHNLKENKSALGFSRLATTVQEEVTKVTEGKQTPVFKPLNVKGDDSGQFVFKIKQENEGIESRHLSFDDIIISKVLYFAFANDTDSPSPNLREEGETLFQLLLPRKKQKHFDLHRDEFASVNVIAKNLRYYKDQVVIFHYGGHAGSKSLFLKDQEANADGFAELLVGQQKNLKLVFLNGCSTQAQVDYLLSLGIPAVIATSCPIYDGLATKFAEYFYDALVRNYTLKDAFEFAASVIMFANDQIHFFRGIETEREVDTSTWILRVANEEIYSWKLP